MFLKRRGEGDGDAVEVKITTIEQALAWGDKWQSYAKHYERLYLLEREMADRLFNSLHNMTQIAASLVDKPK